MVGSGCLVSVGDSGFFTQEERPVVAEVGEPPLKISSVDFQVLRSIAVTLANRFFARFGNDDFPVIPPGAFGRTAVGFSESCNTARHSLDDVLSKGFRGADQPGRGVRAVFGLSGKVGGNNVRVSGVVCNHGNLSGASEHVDADPAVQNAFGFSDKAVARAHQYVGRMS